MDITIEDILNEERDRVECVDSTTRGLPDTTTTSVMPETPPLAKKTKIVSSYSYNSYSYSYIAILANLMQYSYRYVHSV